MNRQQTLDALRRFASVESGTLRGEAAAFLGAYLEDPGAIEPLMEAHAELLQMHGERWLKILQEVARAYNIRLELTTPQAEPVPDAPSWPSSSRPAPAPAPVAAPLPQHPIIPPLSRLPRLKPLVEEGAMVAVFAPSGSGRSTLLRALARALNDEGRFTAVPVSCATAAHASEAPGASAEALLDAIEGAALAGLPSGPPDGWRVGSPPERIKRSLQAWSRAAQRPLVLLLDDVDLLSEGMRSSLLAQLRAGFPDRPANFPWSVVVAGRLDLGEDLGGISLRLPDLSPDDVAGLFRLQGQQAGFAYTEEAVDRAFALTRGQPFLLDALLREALLGLQSGDVLEKEDISRALFAFTRQERLHVDRLPARLREPWARRLLSPLLSGDVVGGESFDEDIEQARSLGLVAPDAPLRLSSPMVEEVVLRVLLGAAESSIGIEPRAFLRPDGKLDWPKILEGFADFWRRHGEALQVRMPWPEVAPQLVLMGWLQRVAGGGLLDREMGVGRGGLDLLLRWPVQGPHGWSWQLEALGIASHSGPDPLPDALVRLGRTLDDEDLRAGTLILFDRRPGASPTRTRFDTAKTPSGRPVVVLRG